MPTIYKRDADRLTIAEAKRAVVEALPRETVINVYLSPNPDGTPNWDGTAETRREENASMYATWIDADFLKACEQLGIVPRWKYRPTNTGYSGDASQDDSYTISHDEFLKYAGLFGVAVEIGVAPRNPKAAPLIAERQPDANRTWWDVAGQYVVEKLKSGQFATAKALFNALHHEAGAAQSPFDKGTGEHRGSLFVRDIGQPLAMKTIQNKWQDLRRAAVPHR